MKAASPRGRNEQRRRGKMNVANVCKEGAGTTKATKKNATRTALEAPCQVLNSEVLATEGSPRLMIEPA
jgi:hypothetical protein